jgi:selenium metabolism protein YedF
VNVNKDLLLILKSSDIADSEPDLGAKLMSSFLNALFETGSLPAKIICMGTGIFLTTEDSPVGDILEKFGQNGTEILSCGTCLEYYGRTDKLLTGNPTNMKDTVGAMMSFKKVLSP